MMSRLFVLLGLALALALVALSPARGAVAQTAAMESRVAPATTPRPAPPWQPPVPHTTAPLHPSTVFTDGWTNLFPALAQVRAVSATDAWAVGDYGRLLHYTGGSWTVVDPPNLRGYPLTDIRMLSATDGWIAGGSQAFHYDGTAWVSQSTGLSADINITRLAPLADDNVWAIGFQLIHQRNTAATVPVALHWDGTQWHALPPLLLDPFHTLFDIAMSGPNDGWITGFEDQGDGYYPLLFHFDGAQWTLTQTPEPANIIGTLYQISIPAPGDVWIAGSSGSYYTPEIYHYHQGTWTTLSLPARIVVAGIFMLNDNEGWATSGTDGDILHWDGASWQVEYSGAEALGISGVAGQIWAVGTADTLLGRAGSGPWTQVRGGPTTAPLRTVSALSPDDAWMAGNGVILHYTAGSAPVVSATGTIEWHKIQMLSATDGYAVGRDWVANSGVIARWDGADWTVQAQPPLGMNGLFMLSSGEGWAVGDGGAIWHDTGGQWSEAPNQASDPLNAVAMDSPSHGWAVGGYLSYYTSYLWEYDGSQWVPRDVLPTGTRFLYDLALVPGGAEGWAVGGALDSAITTYPIVHLRDGAWTVDPTDATALASVAREALGEAWAVGFSGAYHYTSGGWQAADYASNYGLTGIALIPGRGGWAVGPGGTILRYNPLAPGQRFYDVPPDHPFAPDINYLAARQVVAGYDDNTFHPNAAMTRGQLAKMVVLGYALPLTTTGRPHFTDVPPAQPFYSYIETAYQHHIIGGYADGTFRPTANVTRGQAAKIVVAAAGWAPDTSGGPHFADVPPGHPFYAAIETAYHHGILGGYAGGAFRPGGAATRGQLAKILHSALVHPAR